MPSDADSENDYGSETPSNTEATKVWRPDGTNMFPFPDCSSIKRGWEKDKANDRQGPLNGKQNQATQF